MYLPIGNEPGAPPPDNALDEETINPQKPDLTCTPDSTAMRTCKQVVSVEHTGGKAYGNATGFYNKHHQYSEQWNS